MNALQQQASLDDYALSRQVGTHEESIESRFWKYERSHPEVYRELVRLCHEWRAAGGAQWSIKGAFEVLRWQRHVTQRDADSPWLLNNSFTSRYARLVLEREPDLADIFETRALS